MLRKKKTNALNLGITKTDGKISSITASVERENPTVLSSVHGTLL